MSKFSQAVESLGKRIDFSAIWKEQKVSSILGNELLRLAELVNIKIQETNMNVTQYCKQEECWKNVQNIEFHLNEDVINKLVDKDSIQEFENDARRDQKILNGIQVQSYVIEKGAAYWNLMFQWAEFHRTLTEKDRSLLSVASKIPRKIPTEGQCKAIYAIEEIAKREGFFISE